MPINETFTRSVVIPVNIELATTNEMACDIMLHDDNVQDAAINDAARSEILPAEVFDSFRTKQFHPEAFAAENCCPTNYAFWRSASLRKHVRFYIFKALIFLCSSRRAVPMIQKSCVLTQIEVEDKDDGDTDEDMPSLIPVVSPIKCTVDESLVDEECDDDDPSVDA